jgi:hypothetical protein
MELFLRIRPTVALPVMLITVLLLLQSPLFGQATTGTVTGIVADSTGAVIPNAAVVLTNGQTGTSRKTLSNGVGYFVFASVESSISYTVSVTVAKFGPWESRPFPLRPGDEINMKDIRLVVGSETQQVTVEAVSSEVRDLDTGEHADVITAKEIETLAVVGRDATELVRMLPGFDMSSGSQGVNNKPGYNTAVVGLSGPTGSFSANGSGTDGISVVQDGVSLTDIGTNAGTVQNVNVDMISEIKVSTADFGAENAKGPAIVNSIGKSGTSAFHGSGYFYARDTNLNANDWYNNNLQQSRPDGRYFYPGGTIGGPVLLPHTDFNRNRDKLFFFLGYEYSNQLFSGGTLGSWVPTMAERSGQFDQASLNAQLCGGRPDGRANPNAILPMCQTENFVPNGNETVNGNVQGQGNSSGIALINWLPLPNADPFTNSDGFNYVKEVQQTQNGSQFHAKLDYHLTQNDTLTLGYNRQSQISEDPVNYGGPASSILYPGAVTNGDISNALSASYTRVFRANLTNEASGAMSYVTSPGNMGNPKAVDRFDMNGYNCSSPTARAAGTCGSNGNGNYNYVGMYKNGGDYSVPALSDYSNLGYPNMSMAGGFYNNRVRMKKVVPDGQDIITWVKGTHTIKAGIYAERGVLNGLADYGAYPQGEFTFNPGNAYYQYNPNNSQNGQGGSIGSTTQFTGCESSDPAGNQRLSGAAYLGECMNPNALMYLGYADSFTQTNFSPTVDMQYTTLEGFVTDSWKLRNLTLTMGMRLEHIGPWDDRHGNGLATFSSALYASQCGGAGATGEAARSCTGETNPGITWHGINSSVANTVDSPSPILLSPRFGLAWDVLGKGKTILRGGWGVYRSQEEFAPYALSAATAQGYRTSFLQGQLSFDQIEDQSPTNPPDFSAYTISQTDKVRPLHLIYNFTVSQAMPWRSTLEVSYVGNDGNNLDSGYNSASNLNRIAEGTLFNVQLGALPAVLGSYPGDIGGLNTAQTDFYRPYPFYSNVYQLKHNFYSTYNSGQVSWKKSAGRVTFGGNYTFSKNLATAASYNNILADPFNLRNDYNPEPFDHTHVFNVSYLVDLGTHHHLGLKPVNEVINGWRVSGISTLQSGPPLPSINGETFGFGYGLIQPVQVEYENQVETSTIKSQCEQTYGFPSPGFCVTQLNPVTWLGTPDVQLMPTVTCNPSGGPAKHQYINGACFGIPMPETNGRLRPPYLRGPAFMNHDLSLLKDFKMGEQRNLQFRAAGFNFLNHPLVSFNNNNTTGDLTLSQQGGTAGKTLTQADLTQQGFGIAEVKYGNRLVELSVKYQF